MEYLKGRGAITGWRLLRRKLNLANDTCKDFLLEIEFENMTQLDQAFRILGEHDEEVARLYANVNALIEMMARLPGLGPRSARRARARPTSPWPRLLARCSIRKSTESC